MAITLLKRAIKQGGVLIGTDAGYVARGGTWLSASQAIAALASFGAALIFARFVDPETFGMYKYVVALVGVVGSLALTGLATAIVQSVARGYEGLYRDSFRISMRWNLPLILLSIAGCGYYLWNGNATLAFAWGLIGLLLPISSSTSFYLAFLNGRKDFKATFLYQTIRAVVPTGLIVASLLIGESAAILIAAYFLSTTALNLILNRLVMRRYRPNDRIDSASTGYAKHVSLMGILSGVANRFDSLIIFHHLGATPLAIYSFAVAIPDQLIAVSKTISMLALPRFSAHGKETVKATLGKKVAILLVVGGALGAAYAITAEYLFLLLFPAYVSAVPLSQLFAANIALAYTGGIFATYFDAQAEARLKYMITLFSNGSRIALMAGLMFPFGLIGIIWGEIISRALSLCLMAFLAKRY